MVPQAIKRKGELSSSEYGDLSEAAKLESHRLEFVYRNAELFSPTDYLYHMTETKFLESIKESGLVTLKTLGKPNKDCSKFAFISAARTIKGAGSLGTKSTLLRFKPSDTPGPWKAYGGADEVRTMQTVPAIALEKRNAQGEWEPL